MHFTIQRAREEDMLPLLGLAQEFIAESGWGWRYNERNARQIFTNYMTSDESIVLLLRADGKPGGLALLAYDNEFHDERIGYVSKFYISPACRGTRAARMLADCAAKWFDAMGCAASFATATANIKSQGKAFVNLFAKFGYEVCGDTLARSV